MVRTVGGKPIETLVWIWRLVSKCEQAIGRGAARDLQNSQRKSILAELAIFRAPTRWAAPVRLHLASDRNLASLPATNCKDLLFSSHRSPQLREFYKFL